MLTQPLLMKMMKQTRLSLTQQHCCFEAVRVVAAAAGSEEYPV